MNYLWDWLQTIASGLMYYGPAAWPVVLAILAALMCAAVLAIAAPFLAVGAIARRRRRARP